MWRPRQWGSVTLMLGVLTQACASSAHAARPSAAAGRTPAVQHVVARHQTLWSIAKKYGVQVEALRRANRLSANASLAVGQRLVVPQAVRLAAAPGRKQNKAGAAQRASKVGSISGLASASDARRRAERPARAASAPRRGKIALAWPVRGTLTSSFGARGGRPHDGIDIGAPAGTHVAAAADGEVVFANEHRGYGKVVILRHQDGLMTVYAHHRRNHVRIGQKVRRGQLIAEVGSSGRSSGPHLHFEVRHRAQPTNPLRFLPSSRPS